MAVRRLDPIQPQSFAFSPENAAWAEATIRKYPPGKQASAVIPLLWRAQEQEGWVSEPAIRTIAGMLDMAYIRVLEVATFYTMFQLSPVGRTAHIQVCGTTPCQLRGAEKLIAICKRRIAAHAHELSADGNFSWEEVECLGACVNAPMVLIGKDTYEDLTPETFEALIDGFAAGKPPQPGPQIPRQLSAPEGGPTTLTDPTLFDGSSLGAWRKAFEERERARAEAQRIAAASAAAAGPAATGSEAASSAAKPAATAGATATAPAVAAGSGTGAPTSGGAMTKPPLLSGPRNGKPDDLKLIWGVAEKLEEKMNALGIWHFDQIAAWSPAEVRWFEAQLPGFSGRIARDQWIEQAKKLAAGWRPDSAVGERPKG